MKEWEKSRSVVGQDHPSVLENLQRLVNREDRESKREIIHWLVCCLEVIRREKFLEFDIKSIAQRWNILERVQ